MKICLVGAELFQANERTDGHDEAKATLRNCAKVPKTATKIKRCKKKSFDYHCRGKTCSSLRMKTGSGAHPLPVLRAKDKLFWYTL